MEEPVREGGRCKRKGEVNRVSSQKGQEGRGFGEQVEGNHVSMENQILTKIRGGKSIS